MLEVRSRSAAQFAGALCEHKPELGQQATDTVDSGRALFDEDLAHTVQSQHRLLFDRLDRHETHAGSGYRLAYRFCIVAVVLTALAIGTHKLRSHQAYIVAHSPELPSPFVSSRARFKTDYTRWQLRDE